MMQRVGKGYFPHPLQSRQRKNVMGYFRVCENCGAHLDPGEVCDCIGTHGDYCASAFVSRLYDEVNQETANQKQTKEKRHHSRL